MQCKLKYANSYACANCNMHMQILLCMYILYYAYANYNMHMKIYCAYAKALYAHVMCKTKKSNLNHYTVGDVQNIISWRLNSNS